VLCQITNEETYTKIVIWIDTSFRILMTIIIAQIITLIYPIFVVSQLIILFTINQVDRCVLMKIHRWVKKWSFFSHYWNLVNDGLLPPITVGMPGEPTQLELSPQSVETYPSVPEEPIVIVKPLECPICTESYQVLKSRGVKALATSCGHLFCSRCLETALRNNGRQCPNCRQRVVRKGRSTLEIYDLY